MTRVVGLGLRRGLIELRQTLSSGTDLFGYALPAVFLVIALVWMRGSTIPGTEMALGAHSLVGSVAMLIVISGLMTMMQYLAMDREDGTLLRAKATPNGMTGYLFGKIVVVAGVAVISCLFVLVPGLFLVDGLTVGVDGALVLLWLLPLAFLATMPLGAVLGALFDNPRQASLMMLPLLGLTAVSGVFYPVTALAGWLQGVAQVFPVYWLGLGLRSAFLPDALAAAEIGGSWRHPQTAGVLVAWSMAGLVLAPGILRRMARRESGSAVAARRERAMTRMTV
ncbi:ABC-2 type transport system permease protein [Actinoplanes campanulatus]|uniref:ABC-2 type transport system permease protein n=1 Tax=Actinoplanes campanulatus TaxID=113559 RepID=A0A7W5ABT1_9ACTN|nr:ABC transporter permease [Actinoplanes campanulatus]MBB3093187.1 ABC-2 type transport system permease protein [Actinoplanes campanulatus]GGN01818.1 transport permease protein [Actinoplanes campanulatus]GID33717.1 transport permease protein [Actinoplanes campanulatus]